MRRNAVFTAMIVFSCSPAAFAQRFPFERTLDTGAGTVLDVSTIRGKVDVSVGQPGRVVVAGEVTVRLGINVPADAVQLARRIAGNPPVTRENSTIRLRPPAGEEERRAVTVSYRVEVPADTEVKVLSDSGAISVAGVRGSVTLRTQSSAIDVDRLGGSAEISTGSGAVTVDGVAGALTVKTASSAITLRGLQGGTRIRTQSGTVNAAFTGSGDIDIETGSSAITLRNVGGGLKVATQSGRVTASGVFARPWEITTGSGAVEITSDTASFDINATNRSGTIELDGPPVKGVVSKRQIAGAVGGGGPLVRIVTRSGSIRLRSSNPSFPASIDRK